MAKTKLNATDWRLSGNETLTTAGWRYIYGSSNWTNDTVTLAAMPSARPGEVGYINLGLGTDTLIFAKNGNYVLNVLNTEVIKAARANTSVNVKFTQANGFTTDGSLLSIKLDVGHQDLVYTGATLNSTLSMGQGYDQVFFNGTADFDKYWTFIRQSKGQLDAYNLYSGYKVRLQDDNGLNWGQIEKITTANVDGGTTSFMPVSDLKSPGSQGMTQNIDLRSDGQSTSDSFNLAYFNSIRYTSDNVWHGEANISDGVRSSTAGSTSVSGASSLDVIGTYRNGTHDLTVTEQSTAINGQLRLYVFNVASGSYNAFNDVYLGSSASNSADATNNVINGAGGTRGNDVADRVALYGFGGNDQLIGGAANDYIFGGQSVYDRVLYTNPPSEHSNTEYTGNAVTGAAGADYFGVGSTNTSGVVTGANTTATGGQLKGYATDVISDFQAHYDTLVVLSNGVAVIGGLGNQLDGTDTPTDYQTYAVQDMSLGNYIDLRATAAVATSDQDNDGAFGGSTRIADKIKTAAAWDASQSSRDSNSIANESDVTVVNQGLIVARGQGGDDTMLDSSGNDYLYGNGGTNAISLGGGGNDRVYVDTRLGVQNISGFTKSDGTSSNVDKVYLNKGVIVGVGGSLTADSDLVTESFVTGSPDILAGRSLSGNSSVPGVSTNNPGWAKQYYASVFDSGQFSNGNISQSYHDQAYGYTDYKNNIMGGVWSGVGYALNAIPIIGPLLAIYPLYLATSYFANGYKHENLRYTDTTLTKGLTIISAETAPNTTAGQADNKSFLDFFPSADDYQGGDDNFAASLEFTGHSGAIKSYVALYSDDETFVYLINSKDNVVQNNEATLVAEVSGHLTQNDFVMYDGTQDIYNYGSDPVLVYPSTPTITEVISDSDAGLPSTLLDSGDVTRDNHPVIRVTFDGAVNVGDTIKIYDGFTLLYTETVTAPMLSQMTTDGYYEYTDTRNLATQEVIDGANSYHDNPIIYYNVEHISNGLSESSNYFRVEVDTFVDAANSIVLDSDSDFGWTGTDLWTNDNTPTLIIYGGKETQYETTISDPDYPLLPPIHIAGDIVKIYEGETLIETHTMLGAVGLTPNDSNGYEFTFGASDDLVDGDHTFTVKMFDALGNMSSTQEVTVHVDATNPTITSFTSSGEDGYYNENDAINITATTNEAVKSGQYIDVTLDTGDVVRLTAAADGTTLTGTYTVGAGDTSADLNITSFTAGTATDKAGNAVLTTLPTGNNLANNEALVIDTTPPTVTSFTSSTADGYYNESDAINITATISETVTSGQYIDVTLGTGDVVRLTAAANGTTLTGTYTVGAGDTSADLNITSFTTGTLTDLAGNALVSTTLPVEDNLADNQALVIDTTGPTVTYTGWDSTSPPDVDEGAILFSVDPDAVYKINFSDAGSGIASFNVTTYTSEYTGNGTGWASEDSNQSGNTTNMIVFDPYTGGGGMNDSFYGLDHRIQIVGTVTDNAGNTSSFDTGLITFDVSGGGYV